jgi:thiol:disulfide interchange protein DsbD
LSSNILAKSREPVIINADIVPHKIRQGGQGLLNIYLDLDLNYHISGPSSGLFDVILDSLPGVTIDNTIFPEEIKKDYGTIYQDNVKVEIPISVDKKMKVGDYIIDFRIIYQPCDETSGICFLPETRHLKTGFSIYSYNTNFYEENNQKGILGKLTNALEKGSLIAFLLVFLGGFLTSFTPCVYPMIPVTIAVIGVQAKGNRLHGFILSLFYVLGVAITCYTLGIIAARTGALFGSLIQHPIANALISIIFLMMGLSMLGVFVLQLPSSFSTKFRGGQKKGFLSALLTGILAGLIVSPCVSPLLIVILTWVAKTGSLILGFSLLFSFALGLGVLFIIIGTFSGVLKNLPKSGGWTEFIEKGFGILLIILAIVFIRPILSINVYYGIWAFFFIILGTFQVLAENDNWKKKLKKALGLIAIIIGGSLLFYIITDIFGNSFIQLKDRKFVKITEQKWINFDEEGFRQAEITKKPVIIDFFAEWCEACHELDKKTWPDPEVVNELERYVMVKIDLTKNDKNTEAIQKKYNIIGMPTVILFNQSRKELFRFEGYRPPEDVLQILKRY